MNLQQFFEKTNDLKEFGYGYRFQTIRPLIICKDGVSLSVQGSEIHYCQPRYNGITRYSAVEVGYPSVRPPSEWKQYFDGTWQKLGMLGYIERIWKDRNRILWNFKNNLGLGKWYLKSLLSFKDNATNSIYGYVPIALVETFIDNHGGIDEEETFKSK